MKQYALVIDHEACWGCKTCEVACKQEYGAADGIKLIYVSEDGPKIEDGKLDFVFQVNVCRHCDDPPCAEACPEEAISKREDGIVIMDYDLCTGCRACIEACPYDAIAVAHAPHHAHREGNVRFASPQAITYRPYRFPALSGHWPFWSSCCVICQCSAGPECRISPTLT